VQFGRYSTVRGTGSRVILALPRDGGGGGGTGFLRVVMCMGMVPSERM
jgi:hypothetical protein